MQADLALWSCLLQVTHWNILDLGSFRKANMYMEKILSDTSHSCSLLFLPLPQCCSCFVEMIKKKEALTRTLYCFALFTLRKGQFVISFIISMKRRLTHVCRAKSHIAHMSA